MFSFHPITLTHVPLLYQRLHNPDVASFYDDGEKLSLEAYYTKIDKKIHSLTEYAYMVSSDDKDIGYIQCYMIAHENEAITREIDDAEGARGVDMFIGEDAYRGKGYGPQILQQFVESVLIAQHHAASIYIDPDIHNIRAIKAYAKAGFVSVKSFDDFGEEALLMKYSG